MADFLIDAGHENIGISRNSDGETPLMAAVQSGSADMVRLLAARFPRCIPWTNKDGLDAFQLAAQTGHSSILSLLLSLAPDQPALLTHATNDGNTALHLASAWGNMKCIQVLLIAGADPNARNERNFTPMDYSSTVSAEVYFRNLVTEMDKSKAVEEQIDGALSGRSGGDGAPIGAGRRREGYGSGGGMVRMVSHEDDAVSSRARSPTVQSERGGQSGRGTPSGWRDGWGLGLRGRAGTNDSS